ncbi:MAG: FecR family protein [Draconibacterium sp.]
MKEIITKYLEGRASVEEQEILLVWLRNKSNRIAFNSHKLDWEKNSDTSTLPEGSEKSWAAIQDQMLLRSFDKWQNSRRMNLLLRIAAIFFFVISVAGVAYFVVDSSQLNSEYYTEVVAENGQISKVKLPDGSMVWLNSGSKISYNNYFAVNNRAIRLKGEAYFEVERNEQIPLIVESGEMHVKVLGTKFNVAAYPESEFIDVVLEKGKVELLDPKAESFQYFMKPGELASFKKTNKNLAVTRVNTEKYSSWKDGIINVYNQTLEELCKRLENRYNQKFEYEDLLKDFHFTFTIKNEPLDEIIKIMEKVAPIKADQRGEVIVFEVDKTRERELLR